MLKLVSGGAGAGLTGPGGAGVAGALWRLGCARALTAAPAAPVPAARHEKLDPPALEVEGASANKTSGLVAAVFATLNSPETDPTDTQKKPSPKSAKFNKFVQLDSHILKATDINGLLSVAENPIVSRKHALKIVSVLSEWSSSNKIKLSEFETDSRFLKLCRILARSREAMAISTIGRADDLSTVLSITGDDEAARLIANLTLPQMVKVMSALVAKGRRSTPLLRALAHHITSQHEALDLKRAADMLYSMAALSFPDQLLMEKVCSDILEHLPKNDRPAPVSSILVSLGLLRYRDNCTLDALCDWVTANSAICRPQDVTAALLTVATLGYKPESIDLLLKLVLPLRESDLPRAANWLDMVFALLLLEKVTAEHVASVLAPEFVEKLYISGELPIPVRRKLIALDAYASLALASHKVPRLSDEVMQGVPLAYSKEKQFYVQSILETFKSLVSSENFMRKYCDSGMGFQFEGEFVLDAKCHPVPLDKATDKNVFRIALVGLDYHDLCRKTPEPLGVNQLNKTLLELKGYRVLQIPYTEYNPRDKLVTRVQYVEQRLQEIVSGKQALST